MYKIHFLLIRQISQTIFSTSNIFNILFMRTKFLLLSLLVLFTVSSFAQSITVTSPNGSEVLAVCQTFTITWSQTGSPSNYWNIDYSVDGGSQWASVTTNFLSTNGKFTWTVPNANSTTCKIRIRDAQNLSLQDISDANFTITPCVYLTNTNSGTPIQSGQNFTITWNAPAPISGFFNLDYSLNNGSSWSAITTNVAGNFYNWNVPNMASTQALIRINDASQSCTIDQSDMSFTIKPIKPVLTSPNGGEIYNPQCAYNITWDKTKMYTYVNLQYSVNNGSTWTSIASGATNNGAYSWGVPFIANNDTAKCLVRIMNYGDPTSTYDTSNAVFTIKAPYKVNYPNGGETFETCKSYTITWENNDNCNYDKYIYYSTDNGANWINITSVAYYVSSYTWSVPAGINSANCLIKVVNNGYSTRYDVSNAKFSIIPNKATVTVTSPNGAEDWNGASSHLITWDNNADASGTYSVYYSSNGGSSYSFLADVTGNFYTWTLPTTSTITAKVKVYDKAYSSCVSDESNANFTIRPAKPLLTAPNGGEKLNPQCSYNITWDKAKMYTSVTLQYSTNNGSTWNSIISSTSNTGTCAWTVPFIANTDTTKCLVRIMNNGDPTFTYDTSNAVFTIKAPYKLTYPNGGETIETCKSYTITWENNDNCTFDKTLYYSTDNGSTWTAFAYPANNLSSYIWTVPAGLSGTNCRIKVQNYNYSTRYDISDAVFTIIPNKSTVTVTSPNGGEDWNAGSSHQITWVNNADASGTYSVYYSSNGGSSYSFLADVTGNFYTWTLPTTSTITAKVKVYDKAYSSCVSDESNANFTIRPAKPLLTAPNGGEKLNPQCSYNITWDKAKMYTSVTLQYSTNNGSTWNSIISSTSNTGTCAWTVPFIANTDTTKCLVRIMNNGDPTFTYDTSNAVFTIKAPYKLTYPNGGETIETCKSYTITWENNDNCNYDKYIYYSTDNGANWINITSVAYYVSSYTWSVPAGINSANCLIKVVNNGYSTRYDVSNAKFSIIPNKATVTVTSPNGAEDWNGASSHLITWDNNADASGTYSVYYSINGGSSYTFLADVTGNFYTWTLPSTASITAKVQVVDKAYSSCVYDVSNANFTIRPAKPLLTAPNGGESWYTGISQNITWDKTTLYTYATLQYSINNGSTWTTIVNGTSNTGTYNWTVPQANSKKCLIRIVNYNDPTNTYDTSNAVFTIKPAVTILTPNKDNGVTIWGGCTVTSITFDRSPAWTDYSIQYSLDNGSSWTTITSSYTASANPSTYNWNIGNIFSNKALVKVIPNSVPSYYDTSDSTFTISKPLYILNPNFGASMQMGSTYNITWKPDASSNNFDLFYSLNGGSSWNTIVTNYNASGKNSYAWTVPSTSTTTGYIRVRDNLNNCKEDTSNVPFTITNSTGTIVVTSPNRGENWTGCTQRTITWTASGVSNMYNIQYSGNGGSTWTTLVSNLATLTPSYTWNTGTASFTKGLIRIQDASNTAVFDNSDSLFVLNAAPTPVITKDNSITCYDSIVLSTTFNPLFTYQWRRNSAILSGATSNVYTAKSTGSYTVYITSGGCSLSSSPSDVTINSVPSAVITPSNPVLVCGNSVTLTSSAATNYSWNTGATTQTLTVTSPGTYSVTVSNGNNCSNSANVVVTANSLPVVTAGGGGTICNGASVVITAGGASTYSWSNGIGLGASKTVSPTSSITYTVTGTDIYNCSNTATAAVTVYNLPATPTITPDKSTTFCEGDSVKLTSSASLKYSWSPGNQIVQAITVKTTGSFIVTVTDANNCSASSAPTVVTVNPYPVAAGIISGRTSICQGETGVVYSVLPITNASSYNWSLPSGATGISTSNSITVSFDNIALSGDIKVVGHNNCGDGVSSSLTLTLNSIPSAPSVTTPVTYCQNATATQLTATGTNLKWYTVATGGSGNSTAPTPITTNAGTISYYVSQTTNNCESPRAKLDVTVNAIPSAPTVTSPVTYCQNATATQLTATGSNLQWYSVATGGSGNLIAPTPVTTNAGTISYYVSQTTNNCESPRAKLDVTVNAIPSAPTVTTPVTYCQNATASQLTATGTNLKWYSVATGGIGTLTTPTPSTVNVGTISYYVSQTTNNCESPRAKLDVIVNTIPSAPTVTSPVTYCQNATAIQLTATGSNLQWYTVVSGGSGNSTTPTPVTTNTGTISYYVSQTTSNCESPRAKLDVTVNAIPSAPTVTTPVTYCQNATATQLTATGSNLQWYSVATGGSGNLIAPTPVTTNAGTISYYVSQTTSNCESPRAKLDVTVNAIPSAPTVTTPVTYCQNATATQLTATGSNLKWYTVATGGIGSTTAPTPSTTNVGSTTSYVSQTVSGCESPRSSIEVVINSIPSAPSVTTPVTYCQNATATQLTATGTNLKWYTVATGGSGNSTAPTPITTNAGTISYYVSQTTNNCESPRAKLDVTVNAIPSAPTVTSPVTYCQNATATQLTATGSNLQWYSVATGGSGNLIAPTPVTTNTGTISYYVSMTTNNCEGSRAKIDVVVNEIPSAPTVTSPVTLCQNVKAAQLTATGTNLKWYSVPTGGTGGSIAPTPITTTAGTKSYYVSQTINNCESVRAAIEIIVNAIPSTPIITLKSDTLFSNSTINNQWYNATGVILNALNPFYVPSITNDYYVIVSNDGCSSIKSNTIHVLVTDIVNYNKIENILIYPNPVSNMVNIEFENKTKDYNVEIFNAVGQEIYRHLVKSIDNAILRVDLNKQPSGIYFIRMQSSDNIIMRKIMIEK